MSSIGTEKHSKNWMGNDMLSGDGIYVVTCLAMIEIPGLVTCYIWIGDMLLKLVFLNDTIDLAVLKFTT